MGNICAEEWKGEGEVVRDIAQWYFQSLFHGRANPMQADRPSSTRHTGNDKSYEYWGTLIGDESLGWSEGQVPVVVEC